MGNDAKILDQPVAPQAPIQPASPIGIPNKEMGPIPSIVSEIRPAGPEVSHEIDQELKELGVEQRKEAPDLTLEHRGVGLDHSGEAMPVPQGPTGLVQIPEQKDVNSSGTWLNTLLEKIRKVGELMGV